MFVQVALPLTGSGAPLDLSTYRGIRLTVKGNGETYHIHLRTTGTALPWQHYHAVFPAGAAWATIDLVVSENRTDLAHFTPSIDGSTTPGVGQPSQQTYPG